MGQSIRDFGDFIAQYQHTIGWISLGILAIGLLYGAIGIFMAWWSVLTADRDNYFICDQHGAIRDVDMLTMIEGGMTPEGVYEEPIRMCPVCYTERGKEAYAKLTREIDKRNSLRDH